MLDVALNYGAIAFNLLPIVVIYYQLPPNYVYLRYVWIPLTILLFLFQIGLCLLVDCFGVSIVWSALCGFAIRSYTSFKKSNHALQLGKQVMRAIRQSLTSAVLLSSVLWTYYAFLADPMTTLAHFCAVLLGICCGMVVELFLREGHHNIPYLTLTDQVLS